MKTLAILIALSLCGTVQAVEHVSVGDGTAILYDAPSLKAKKLFVVNRFMPFEQVVSLDNWVKVRDHSGGLYWLEKRVLTNKKYVFALNPMVDVRKDPDEGAARLIQVRAQVALELLENTGTGWVKVRHKDGETGYVRSVEVWGE
jgi:SH3-like domain-containing protein